jgi:hypothetical protein
MLAGFADDIAERYGEVRHDIAAYSRNGRVKVIEIHGEKFIYLAIAPNGKIY